MALHYIKGDILQLDVEAIVISANPEVCEGGELGKAVYEAAGHKEMMEERRKIGHIKKGTSVITPGYRLKSSYVIHTVPPTWRGGDRDERYYLKKCYDSALDIAKKNGIGSVAFVLLGAGYNRVPYEKALEMAKDTINAWFRASHTDMKVYLVTDKEDDGIVIADEESQTSLAKQREVEWQKYRCDNPNKTRADFNSMIFRQYLNERIDNDSAMEEKVFYSNIGKLKAGEIGKPNRKNTLALAIGMELSKEERYDFMKCAGYDYPSDEREKVIEELLDRGKKSMENINMELEKMEPKWVFAKKEQQKDER